MNRTIPAGWSFEPSDPSVGIFGHLWVHEECEEEGEVIEEPVESWYEGDGFNRYFVENIILTCPCGAMGVATMGVATEGLYDPDDEGCPND